MRAGFTGATIRFSDLSDVTMRSVDVGGLEEEGAHLRYVRRDLALLRQQ